MYKFNFSGFRELKTKHLCMGNISSRYSYTSQYITFDDKPVCPIVGEFHFSRCDPQFWREELQKMKAGGMTMVSTYVFWNMHEKEPHIYDFSGDRDIKRFLQLCKEEGLPVIMRMGPWAHGEARHGGFPRHINKMIKKRSDDPIYLAEVELFWTELYKQVKQFCDGNTIWGIQLENEYCKGMGHILTLKKMAIKIGFKTPFFTMTAWPENNPNPEVFPMFGGYPDAPWHHLKRALKPNNRFIIARSRTENEIGEDQNEIKKAAMDAFDDYPYSSCEVGPGNHVTQHRRPIIDTNSGYCVMFSKIASGLNMWGYYMYRGGRNPNDELYQESRRTLYPNNHQIIDYDFQAPLSRFGYPNELFHKLRILHYLPTYFDKDFVTAQTYFLQGRSSDVNNDQFSSSIRIKKDLSGYLFINNFERQLTTKDWSDCNFEITNLENIKLPTLTVKKDATLIVPFNFNINGDKIDYVTAQPIAVVKNKLFFLELENNKPVIRINGKDFDLMLNDSNSFTFGGEKYEIFVLTKEKAFDFYVFDNKEYYSKSPLFLNDGKISMLSIGKSFDVVSGDGVVKSEIVFNNIDIKLTKSSSVKLPLGYYLYSYGKRNYYQLSVPKTAFNGYDDIILNFEFMGSSLQMFADKVLINDFFNIEKKWSIGLKEYRKLIESGADIIIKTAPKMRFGTANFYDECKIAYGDATLKLVNVVGVKKTTFSK